MIDFSGCPVNRFRAYGGANGNKINISYQGHSYMLKFPPRPSRNKMLSYTNSCISEYVACHIFEMLGFKVQETLLGNFDRHNGNWGLLVDEQAQSAEIAPIYDCGSCLYPQLDLERMAEVLKSQEEIDRRIYVFPASSIEEHGVKIPYYDFISSHRYPECSDALKRISARIDLDAIQNFLEEISELQPVQREFYLTILTERKEKILDHSLHLMMEREQRHVPEMKM